MEKLDLTKQYKNYYTAKNKPELLVLPKAQYIGITGKGDPSGPDFALRIQALYPVAYGIKALWKAEGADFGVPKLEGLWWFDAQKYGTAGSAYTPKEIPRSEWYYQLLIRMPDYVTAGQAAGAAFEVAEKKGNNLAKSVDWVTMPEQTYVQMLHVGPFDTEPETLQQLYVFMEEHGLEMDGKHHEIYLSDFRKTAPEKLKTILREPVRKKR